MLTTMLELLAVAKTEKKIHMQSFSGFLSGKNYFWVVVLERLNRKLENYVFGIPE